MLGKLYGKNICQQWSEYGKTWKNTYISNDLYYRLIHHSTKTNEYMHKCTRDINPKCDHCGYTEENKHLLQNVKESGHTTN